jgi:hypothetical protein
MSRLMKAPDLVAAAFARDLQLEIRVAENGVKDACSFRWDEGRLAFVRSAGE